MTEDQQHHQAHHEVDVTLGRLDQRTSDMANTLGRIEEHLKESNGYIRENSLRSSGNQGGIRRIYWLLGGAFMGFLTLLGLVVAAIAQA